MFCCCDCGDDELPHRPVTVEQPNPIPPQALAPPMQMPMPMPMPEPSPFDAAPPPTAPVIEQPVIVPGPVYPPLPILDEQRDDANGDQNAFCWRDCSGGSLPPDAVRAGRDKDGELVFVGRAFHEGDTLPAKVVPAKGGAFVAWGGEEHSKYEYEVLCDGEPAWVMSSGSIIPEGAVPGGITADGERLYIGRVMHDGAFAVGKVQPSHGVCYIPYGGQEIAYGEYEILVGK